MYSHRVHHTSLTDHISPALIRWKMFLEAYEVGYSAYILQNLNPVLGYSVGPLRLEDLTLKDRRYHQSLRLLCQRLLVVSV